MAFSLQRRKMVRASGDRSTPRRKVSASNMVCKPMMPNSSAPAPERSCAIVRVGCDAAAHARCRSAAPSRSIVYDRHQPRGARRRLLAPVAALAHANGTSNQHSTGSAAAAAGVEGALTTVARVVVPYYPTSHGQQMVLVGSCEALGNWDPKKGVRFTWCEGHSHVAEIELPIHNNIACKLVVLGDNNNAVWEPEANRELLLAPTSLASRAAGYTVLCHWGFPDSSQLLANSLRRGGAAGGSGSRSGSAGHQARSGSGALSGENPIIAGVKKALAHASSSSRERFAVLPGISSLDEDGAVIEEEPAMVQCQVTVLVPKNGPKIKPEQSLVLVGSSATLGRWDPANGLPLERASEESAMWTAQTELPLADGLQAKVVVVDSVSGQAQVWEPCENRTLARFRGGAGARPVMVTSYWGLAPTHCLEVDRLSASVAASSPQVVQLLRQQLAATSTQLDGLRKERDEARKAMVSSEDHIRRLETEVKAVDRSVGSRQEMVQLAQQLQNTRRLYEVTKKEAQELGGTVGVTRQLCDAAKRELSGLAQQLEAAKRAYEALAPQVERMERQLASTTRAFESTKPELAALETQLERARNLFDRTLQKIEAAKMLAGTTSSGEFDPVAVRRRGDVTTARVREVQFAKS